MHPRLISAHQAPEIIRPVDSPPPTLLELGNPVTPEVQCGLCLSLRLKSPAQMPALLMAINTVKPKVQEALRGLHYVHFARFVPTPDMATLLVITEFDGDQRTTPYVPGDEHTSEYNLSMASYLMDFVVTMGDIFDVMLDFVVDAPRLPVRKYYRDFIAFVEQNNQPIPIWSAYPDKTVIDIISTRGRR